MSIEQRERKQGANGHRVKDSGRAPSSKPQTSLPDAFGSFEVRIMRQGEWYSEESITPEEVNIIWSSIPNREDLSLASYIKRARENIDHEMTTPTKNPKAHEMRVKLREKIANTLESMFYPKEASTSDDQ